MFNAEPSFGIPEMPMISPQVATLIPFGVARRLHSVAISATPTELTILSSEAGNVDALDEIRALTGRDIVPIDTPVEDMDRLLECLCGQAQGEEIWLQQRHIAALTRLADNGLNLGQGDAVRSLVDRALEFAPYSAELWLTKARVSIHRSDVVEALTIAVQIAPGDRRILRWIQSIKDSEAVEPVGTPEPMPWMPHPLAATSGRTPATKSSDLANRAAQLAEDSFGSAREITSLRDTSEVLRSTAQSLQSITSADSVSVYFRRRRGWTGRSTHPALQERMDQALPKSNRVAAQALKQGLPIVVADTSARLEDVGPLVAQTGIRSFALIPIPGRSAVEGLAYINFDQVERAGSVFDPDVSKAIEVVLNSAAATFAALIDKSGDELEDAIDDTTDSYTLKQFTRLLSAEMERARRYRFSVSVLALDIDTGTGPEMRLPDDTARAVVAAMSTCARASDIVGHGRNNFFALMLPQTTSKGAALVARRVEDAVSAVLWTPGAAATSVRVGVATFPDSGTDAASLIEAARMPAVTNPAPTRPDGFHVSSVRKGDS